MSKTNGAQPQAQSAAAALQAKLDQGLALHQHGKLADAERIYGEVLQQQPNHFDALHLLGVIALQTRRAERAVELITKAIGLNARAALAHSNLGNAFKELKRPEDALTSYDRAVALEPNYAEAHNNRGIALTDLNRPEEALASFDRAIALKPDYAEAYIGRGIALTNLNRPKEALASFEKPIALKPDSAEAHGNRGNVLRDLNCPEDALASFDKAIGLKPNFAEAHSNRGNALKDLTRFEEALASFDRAIALKPNFAEAHSNRGNALKDLKRPEEALASFDRTIALNPDFADAYWNRSLCLLLMGRFAEGWREYEWRKKRTVPTAARSFRQPLWLGEQDIAGKTLFLWWEQGLGDTIQFCRYAKLVEARGAKVVMSVQQHLPGLLQQISPTIQIIGDHEVPTEFEYHCPLLSLPLAFRTTLETIPAEQQYLKADEKLRVAWAARLPRVTKTKETSGEQTKLRVGLVWSGGFRPDQPAVYERRNIPLAKLAALKDPHVEFYSLQKGQPAESELAELIRQNWDGPHIVDFTSELKEFSDTAALIENLDLVISVDTSTAHLAAALGKPVWILNRFDTCWRWLLDRTDSPWYPSVKLYRQEAAGDWDAVVARVKMDLTRFRAGKDN